MPSDLRGGHPALLLSGGGLPDRQIQAGSAALEGTRIAGAPATAEKFLTETNFDALERLEGFAKERGHSVLELSFAWLSANALVGSVIAGATETW